MIDANELLTRIKERNPPSTWYERAYVVFHGRGPMPLETARAYLQGNDHGLPGWKRWMQDILHQMWSELTRPNTQQELYQLRQQLSRLASRVEALECRLDQEKNPSTSNTLSSESMGKGSGGDRMCTPFSAGQTVGGRSLCDWVPRQHGQHWKPCS